MYMSDIDVKFRTSHAITKFSNRCQLFTDENAKTQQHGLQRSRREHFQESRNPYDLVNQQKTEKNDAMFMSLQHNDLACLADPTEIGLHHMHIFGRGGCSALP